MKRVYSTSSIRAKSDKSSGLALWLLLLFFITPAAHTDVLPDTDTPIALQQAIKKITERKGPPGAYQNDRSNLMPVTLIQNSLWQRLRNNFEFTDLDHPSIDAQIRFMQKGMQSLTSNLHGATDFLFYIVDEVDRAGLPLDIALLPLVESAFNPLAVSQQGAAGLWQFIPATAKDYGLPRTESYDGRNDLIQSTDAAIRYLKRLHKTFDDDWMLALAAYNTGPGNVRNAMRRAKQKGLTPDFWNLRLARETRDYVPRLIAVNKMITDPEHYGLKLPTLNNRKIISTVAVGRPISLKAASELAGISEKKMHELNTGYLQGSVPLGGPYHLTVPVEASRRLVAELSLRKINAATIPGTDEDSAATTAATTTKPPMAITHIAASYNIPPVYKPYKKYVYQSHTVSTGDNLWDISRSMRTSVETLKQWNGKSPDSKKMQPGDKMIVAFMDTETKTDVSRKLINYRVTPTDNLLTIADRFSISVSQLKKWNPALWQKNTVQAGQAIKIPIQTSSGF